MTCEQQSACTGEYDEGGTRQECLWKKYPDQGSYRY